MEEIRRQLDEAVLDIFQVLEDLYKKQAELEQTMKNGFFTMARARYNMGVQRVSADQIIDAEFIANNTVELSTLTTEDEQGHSDRFQNMFVLCNAKISQAKSEASKCSDSDELDKESDSSLRKRGAGVQSTSLDKELKECLKLIDSDDDKKFKLRNPINLFGVLVPQALRSSQSSFEEAVRLSIDIANNKNKLKVLQMKIAELKQEKSKFSVPNDSSQLVKT